MSDYHISSETRQLKFNQQRQKMKDNMAKKHVQQIKSIQSSDNNHSKLSLKFTLLRDNYSPLLSEENNNHEKVNKSKFAYDGPQAFELKDLENDEGSEIEVVHLGDEVVPVKSSAIDNIMSLESNQYDDMEEIKETVIPSNFEYSPFGFEEIEYDGNNHGEEEDWNILKSKNSSDTLNSQLHFSSEILTNTEQRDNHFNDSISGSLNTSGVAVAPCATDSPRNNTDSINYVESFPVENDRFHLQLFNKFIDAPLEIEKFVTSPAPENCIIHCRISRDKRGVDKGMFPIYYLHLERNNAKPMFLLAARRRKMSKTSNYLISCDPTDMTRDGFGFLAKLRSNFVGTQFSIFDNGESPGSRRDIDKPIRKELAAAIYESNVLGFKGPRRMTIIIPGMTTEKVALDFSPGEHEDGLIECWKKRNMNKLLELHNKKPVWNDDSQSYVLNFHGRVTQASVKNFQIVHDNDVDYIVMQFGRTSDHSFSMDYSYPLSAVQAFGIALSSFDGKLACE